MRGHARWWIPPQSVQAFPAAKMAWASSFSWRVRLKYPPQHELPRVGASRVRSCAVAPPGVGDAYDLMVADRVPPELAADMAMAAVKSGKDPVAFARLS